MPQRTPKPLLAIAGLALVVAGAGTAARGSDVTPPSPPAVTASTAVPTVDDAAARAAEAAAQKAAEDQAATDAAAAAKAAADRAAAEKAATDKAAADKARADQAAADKAAADKAKAAAATWAVTKVVDGDTIWASRGGSTVKVRLIGIDTPESGACGYTEATRNLRAVIGGQRVTLTAGARDDVDRYGRVLRYVDVNGVDAGLRQIKQGYAVARYDSRDGYGRHAREAAYVRADIASPKAACTPPSSGGTTSGGTTGGTTSSWPLSGDRYPCPQARPVKGNEDSMIAHEPGDRYYLVTKPEQCFATMTQAISAGFRPAKV